MTPVIISTDGSGTRQGSPGGWAAVLRYRAQDQDRYLEISGGVPDATSNRMEMMAAIMALETLKRPCYVHLTTDSEYLKEGAARIPRWISNGWHNFEGDPIKNQDLWERLWVQLQRHRVTWFQVEGHTDKKKKQGQDVEVHVDNCRCDELAGIERRKFLPEKVKPVSKRKKKASAAPPVAEPADSVAA